jgi:hypothetical protein
MRGGRGSKKFQNWVTYLMDGPAPKMYKRAEDSFNL